jgi:uncharacterized repeat protein (TIGR04042 family)
MPEMHYTVRWPDARETVCYSPSLVVRDLLEPGRDYPLADFMQRVREATTIANERVQAKYGFVCSRANDQLARLEIEERRFADQAEARVHVLSFDPA